MIGNIDRISEGFLVVILEDGKELLLEKEKYKNLKPGQVINIDKNIITVDEKATLELKKKIIELQNKLFI